MEFNNIFFRMPIRFMFDFSGIMRKLSECLLSLLVKRLKPYTDTKTAVVRVQLHTRIYKFIQFLVAVNGPMLKYFERHFDLL